MLFSLFILRLIDPSSLALGRLFIKFFFVINDHATINLAINYDFVRKIQFFIIMI
ncbi:hypothetical protein CpB0410 [Chlamydia pneumoniae TW-183]|uniref:Uncharacterized protein n=1 Tax=Chlamydia pneumoniae TaxID=83558 RepID=A0ABM5LCG9_CHLPN|nr:hypothetical protein CpB0410 [Chlamydia pneumoniae TW-183]